MCSIKKGPHISKWIKWKEKVDLHEWIWNDKNLCFSKGITSFGSPLSILLKAMFGTILESTNNLDEDVDLMYYTKVYNLCHAQYL